jgi:hypothetical protein
MKRPGVVRSIHRMYHMELWEGTANFENGTSNPAGIPRILCRGILQVGSWFEIMLLG